MERKNFYKPDRPIPGPSFNRLDDVCRTSLVPTDFGPWSRQVDLNEDSVKPGQEGEFRKDYASRFLGGDPIPGIPWSDPQKKNNQLGVWYNLWMSSGEDDVHDTPWGIGVKFFFRPDLLRQLVVNRKE